MSVVVYVGKYRSRCGVDSGAALVSELGAAGVDIAAVLLNAGDPLADQLSGSAQVLELPSFLSLPRAQIVTRLAEDGPQRQLRTFAERVRALRPQVGLLYYGSWLPHQLASVPPLGFLNFHPAPLPYLRGFECNTFAILRGCPRFHATVHQVHDDYDVGPVYALSPEESLDPWCVPPELLARVDRYAPAVLAEALGNRLAGRQVRNALCPEDCDEFVADRARLLEHCRVDWESDSLVQLWRKFRALCGQQTGLRLRARLNGATQFVDDLLVLDSTPHARPGAILGRCEGPGEWAGRPVVACCDGSVALKLGGEAPAAPSFHEGPTPTPMNRDLLRQRCRTTITL